MADQDRYRFRRLDTIGAADATQDTFLRECFVDTGDLEVLANCTSPRALVLGRTGSGKTALLQRLAESRERAIEVRPESLALSYLSNSNILQFLTHLGVKLDTFFRLLWRHVFVVEIIKAHCKFRDETDKASFFDWLRVQWKGKRYAQAIGYLEQWGKDFWVEADHRIKEITTRFETEIKASIGASVPPASLNAAGAKALEEEIKHEVFERTQRVVNQVQIRQLSEILDGMNDLLHDPKRTYYIIIDRLDEDWVEEKLKYLLIRALIETVRDFRRVQHAKIIVALRRDLIERVFRLTRDAGFQEEKYQDLYIDLKWTKARLAEILDLRINHLIARQYTRRIVGHRDILPGKMDNQPTIDYILDRTLMRPRDIIQFFNECLAQAVDNPKLTPTIIRNAETEYSRRRFRSLLDEWYGDYPNLGACAAILKGRNSSFGVGEITDGQIEDLCVSLLVDDVTTKDELSIEADRVFNRAAAVSDMRKTLVRVFYRVGLIGVKLQTFEKPTWSVDGLRTVTSADLRPEVRVLVHPCFWRFLGINAGRGKKSTSRQQRPTKG